MIIVDESYFEYYDQTAVELVKRYENLIVVRSFSEAFGLAGYPCAYIITSPKNISEMNRHRHNGPSDATQIAAVAAISDLTDLRERIETTRESMAYLAVRLRQFGLSCRMTPTNVLLLQVAESSQVASILRRNNIFAEDVGFVPQLENYVALTVSNPAAAHKVVETFENISESVYRFKPAKIKKVTLHRTVEETAVGDRIPHMHNESAGGK